MSVQPSLLKCPSCADQLLETVTTALGSLERCPTCLSLWVEQKLIAAYSDDKTVCRDALAETKTLLLPADRWCPKCFQKMVDGRVRSRSVVLHLCITCEALWIDWETLRKFDEFIERALKAQVEAASLGPPPQTSAGSAYLSGSAPAPAWTQIEDTGVGKVFRSMARTFDSIADGVGGTSAYTQPPKVPKPALKKPPVKAPAPKIPKEPVKENKERKILKADELPPEPVISGPVAAGADMHAPAAPDPIISGTGAAGADTHAPAAPDLILSPAPSPFVGEGSDTPSPAPPPPPPVEVPKVEIPKEKISHVLDFMSILETMEERERAPQISEPPPPVLESPPLPSIEDFLEPEPVPTPIEEKQIQHEEKPVEKAEPEPVEIKTESVEMETEPQTEPQKEPQKEPQHVDSASAISDLLGGVWDDGKDAPVEKNKKPAAPPAAKPIFAKPEKKGPGLFGKLGAAFKPKPKMQKPEIKKPIPGAPKPEVEIKKTAPAPNASGPAPILKTNQPKPAKTKKEGPGLFAKAAGLFKRKPKPPKPDVPAAVSAKPVSLKPAPLKTKEKIEEALKTPSPLVGEGGDEGPKVHAESVPSPKPSPTRGEGSKQPKPVFPKPAAKPKVVGPKTKRNPGAVALRLLPWVLALAAFLINYARGYDFELSFALLWSACAWSVGTMIRLFLLYPFQDFMEISLAALLDYPGLSAAKGFPVTLMGRLEPENPDIPKGPLAFVQDEKKLGLNKTGAWEITSTFFGLKNPAQFAAGEVTLKGWYRKTEPPYLEVSVALIGKKRRTSSVRALRWAAAICVLAVAGLILMTAE